MSAQAGQEAPQGLAGLSPANFGMVMATGIVSIAAQRLGQPGAAQALLGLNAVLYAGLWLLTLLRLARHRRRVLDDLADHLRGPGFFTTVAGTAVLGSQCVLVAGQHGAALALWVLAAALWLVLIYGILAVFTLKARKPALDKGISGAWLLAVVATQSIAVLGALLSTRFGPQPRLAMNFLALAMWLWGGMLYIWMMSLIFYRYTFFTLAPGDLTPPSWINMGAMAISTLAGALLVQHAAQAPLLQSLLPFIKGFTLFYWATGTWWIPMLLVLGVWRYVARRHPLRYDPMYWAAVFPLGMYAVCTLEMARALELGFLQGVPPAFGIAAGLAWLSAFGGLLARLAGLARRRGALSKAADQPP
ncbi:MAG: tellurite resistance/C4-dicarboxylate transporter family protein [Rubrivivax sp.]